MRLIDADALSEKLCKTTIFVKDGEAFQRMINDAPTVSAEAVRDWIPCSERLPECEQEVLICTEKKEERAMIEQMSMFPPLGDGEDAEDLKRQVKLFQEYAKQKRNWENAFQKWSDKHGMQEMCVESWGCCGYGSMCDWCEDNSYGRPCVRALNDMCREKNIHIDYSDRDFAKIWDM